MISDGKFVIQITAGREFRDNKSIRDKLQEYVTRYGASNIILRHGNAKGGDKLSGLVARSLGIKTIQERPVEYYNFDWNAGLDAGNLRNEAMLDEEPIPNIVLAFPDPNSKGTCNMIESAKERGLDVWINSHNNPQNPTSIETDIAFGVPKELASAELFTSIVYSGASVHRLPEHSDLDFAITRENELRAFIEIKARRISVDTYETTIIPLRKHEIAAAIYKQLQIPVFAVIVFTDALVSLRLDNTPDATRFIQREDRDVGMMHAEYRHSRFTYHISHKKGYIIE